MCHLIDSLERCYQKQTGVVHETVPVCAELGVCAETSKFGSSQFAINGIAGPKLDEFHTTVTLTRSVPLIQGNRMNKGKLHHSSTVSQEIGGGWGGVPRGLKLKRNPMASCGRCLSTF